MPDSWSVQIDTVGKARGRNLALAEEMRQTALDWKLPTLPPPLTSLQQGDNRDDVFPDGHSSRVFERVYDPGLVWPSSVYELSDVAGRDGELGRGVL